MSFYRSASMCSALVLFVACGDSGSGGSGGGPAGGGPAGGGGSGAGAGAPEGGNDAGGQPPTGGNGDGGDPSMGGAAGGGAPDPGMFCVGDAFVASCETQIGCTDYYGSFYTVAALEAFCTAPNTFSTGPCDPTGTVGSCEQDGPSQNQCGHVWAFPPSTTEQVQAGCMGVNQTFHAP